MIIDKVQPYWTDKDLQRLEEIRAEQNNLIADHVGKTTNAGGNVLGKWQKLEEESQQIIAEVERHYIDDNDDETILSDAKEIVNAIGKKDFQAYIATYIEQIEGLKAEGVKESSLNVLKSHAKENYENFYRFLLANVRVQLNAVANDEERTSTITAWIEEKTNLLYTATLQSIRPTKHIMPNNALMNKLQQEDIINAGHFDLTVSNATNRKKEITAYTIVYIKKKGTCSTDADTILMRMSEYERQVFNGIVSIWTEAITKGIPPIIYPELVYKAMPGGGDKASPQQKGAIYKVIEKFRYLYAEIDVTEEMRERKVIGEDETKSFDDWFLTARHIKDGKTKNGRKKIEHAYLITSEPILLSYCRLTNQLLSVSSDYLAIEKVKEFSGKKITTGELLPMTASRQAMTGYILRRILVMDHDERDAKEEKRRYDRRREKNELLKDKPLSAFRHQSRIIKFETLFDDVDLGDQTKQSAANNRTFVFQVLDFLKFCKKPLIKDYKKQTRGHIITGVEIIL